MFRRFHQWYYLGLEFCFVSFYFYFRDEIMLFFSSAFCSFVSLKELVHAIELSHSLTGSCKCLLTIFSCAWYQ